jgi:orotate phosphoribosyltransferase
MTATKKAASQQNQKIIQALLKIKAIKFVFNQPITFKSGMLSPVYVDNRILPAHPQEWKLILDELAKTITTLDQKPDIIAGIETAGIPHSAALGYILDMPSVFIRKKAKDHGTRSLVEGGSVEGKNVVLIEDHISTGFSSLKGVVGLREAGAKVTTCLSITNYGFPEARSSFAKEKVDLVSLVSFDSILKEAVDQKLIAEAEAESIQEWMDNPWEWGES